MREWPYSIYEIMMEWESRGKNVYTSSLYIGRESLIGCTSAWLQLYSTAAVNIAKTQSENKLWL